MGLCEGMSLEAFKHLVSSKAYDHWLLLQHDPNGDEWGAPLHANILVSMCNALGFMEFVVPWNPSNPLAIVLMSRLPIIRFLPIIQESAKTPQYLN